MPILASAIVRESESYRANRAAHLALIDEFRTLEAKVRETSNRAEKKFRSRGQLLPREPSASCSTATCRISNYRRCAASA